MTKANSIRQFVNTRYIEPARAAGKTQVCIRAGDVHSAMNLKNSLPAVCAAIGANVFETTYRVKRKCVTGPISGANMFLTFEVEP